MSPRIRVILGLAFCVSLSAFGKATNIQRGGFGILFPDHNSFANPGQFAVTHGMAVEALYTRTNQTPTFQSITPSLVYGNGRIGIGAFGNRLGGDLGSSAETLDSAGAGIGMAFLKQRLTLGVSFAKSFEGGEGGLARASMTLQSPSRKGPSVGLVFDAPMSMAGAKNAATLGLGYAFRSNASMEANVRFADFNDMNNFVASGFFTLGGGALYFGAGYQWNNPTAQHEALARLGVMLGSQVDISLLASHGFASGSPVVYGGSLRASF